MITETEIAEAEAAAAFLTRRVADVDQEATVPLGAVIGERVRRIQADQREAAELVDQLRRQRAGQLARIAAEDAAAGQLDQADTELTEAAARVRAVVTAAVAALTDVLDATAGYDQRVRAYAAALAGAGMRLDDGLGDHPTGGEVGLVSATVRVRGRVWGSADPAEVLTWAALRAAETRFGPRHPDVVALAARRGVRALDGRRDRLLSDVAREGDR